MANRYWVGGTGTWNTTSTTNWSATSGGASGASVPTTSDNVIFDQAGTYTVTLSGALACLDFTISAGSVSISNGAGGPTINIAGSMSLVAGTVWSVGGTCTITFSATTTGKTITTNGTALFANVVINGAGGDWTLGGAFSNSSGTFNVTSGTFNTGGFNVTTASIASSNTNTRAINLGASTLTLSATNVINFGTPTNLTFNAGTSQFNLSNTDPTITSGNQTFYNVSFTSTSIGTRIIDGGAYNDLTLVASSSGLTQLSLSGDITVNGTLTCAGSSAIARGFVRSNTLGTVRVITAATLSANDCDFRDIDINGGAVGTAPTRAGDCGGNTDITFPAAKSVYRVGTNTTWVGSASWATSSGGTGNNDNFPLAQDTAVIDNSTTLTGTLSLSAYNISGLDASTRTTGITFDHGTAVTRYGSYVLGSGVTVSGTSGQTFSGRGTMDFTSAGKTITFPITVDAPGGTFRLLDATTLSNTVTLTRGTLNLNDFTLTATTFSSINTNTRTLAFGTGNITVTSTGTVFNTSTVTGLTITGTPVVNVTNATATATTVSPGSPTEANSISFNFTAGSYALTLSTGNVLNLNFTGFAGTLNNVARTIYGTLTVSTGMTLTGGTSAQTFGSTSGTARDITANGKTFDFPVTFNGVGGTWRLIDTLTMGAARAVTHTNGTLNLNGQTLTIGATGSYTTAAGTKDLTFNGGILNVTASGGTAFNNAQPTNFTTTAGTGTGEIRMTSASAKTFVGGGSTYDCTLTNNGAGALTITGSNTFTTLANGVQPTTFSFTAGTTTTLTNWNINGTAGNLVTIGSVTAASHTLTKPSGTVSADYLSISRSTATGGAAWYAGANSTDGGNNTGWIFGVPAANQGNFLMFFM